MACPHCRAPLIEDPHTYFPQRFSAGAMKDEGLEVALRERTELLPWDLIRMVCLGIVEEPAIQIHPTLYMQIKQSLKKVFDKQRQDEQAPLRQNVYLEIFVADKDQPFRAESTNLNYRGFIEEVEYVSENNFKKLLKKLMDRLPNCEFDESYWAYVSNKKENVKRFGNIYEFQRACQARWQKQREEKG